MVERISVEECNRLFTEYNTPKHVIGHCRAVSDVAYTIGLKLNENGMNLDLPLIKGAGLAHDVLRVMENHDDRGAELLEKLGYYDEAAIVKVHMKFRYTGNDEITESTLVCLGDRLVKEDHYVGLDERMEYIIHKAGDRPESTKRILDGKAKTRKFMDNIEKRMGQTIDSLFDRERHYTE